MQRNEVFVVFISHSIENKDVANRVVAFLEGEGCKCWITPRDIQPGAHWTEEIISAIEKCDTVILILSRHSNSSPHVRREVEQAVSLRKRIVPLVIEDVKLSKWMRYCISIHQWHDACMGRLELALPLLYEAVAPSRQHKELSTAEEIEEELQQLVSGTGSVQLESGELKPVIVVSVSLSNGNQPLTGRLLVILERLSRIYSGVVIPSERNSLLRCYFGIRTSLSSSIIPSRTFADRAFGILERLYENEEKGNYGIGLSAGTCEVRSMDDFLLIRGQAVTEADMLSAKGGIRSSETYARLHPEATWIKTDQGFEMSRVSRQVADNAELPLAGRREVLSLLNDLLKRQRISRKVNRRGGAVHIVQGIQGKAGFGKTRLLHEFLEGITESHHVISFSCGAAGESTDFTDFITDRYRLTDTSPHAEPDGEVQETESDEKQLFFAGVRDAITPEINEGLVIVLDDAHKLSPSEIDLLQYIVSNTDSRKPMVMILLYRRIDEKGRRVRFSFPENYADCDECELTPLNGRETGELVESLLGKITGVNAGVSSELTDTVFRKTNGNPFFILEVVKRYKTLDFLGVEKGEWRLQGDVSEVDSSLTLASTIRSSIDSLPESWKRALQICSVIGTRLPISVVQRIDDSFSSDWFSLAALEYLVERDFLIRKQTAFIDVYEFRHDLLRDSAISSITEENRKRIHKEVACAFEKAFFDNENYHQTIAVHWGRTDNRERQVVWFEKALDVCLRTFKYSEAVDWLDLLMPLVPGRLHELTLQKSKILGFLGRNRERVELLKDAVQKEESEADSVLLAELRLDLGKAIHDMGEIAAARHHLSAAYELVSDQSETVLHNEIKLSLGSLHVDTGDFDKAREYLDSAKKFFSESDYGQDLARTYRALGELSFRKGDMRESISLCEKGFEIAEGIFNKSIQLECAYAVGRAHMQLGEYDEALTRFSNSAEIASELGYRTHESVAVRSVGSIHHFKGDVGEALKSYKQAYSIAKEIDDKLNMGAALKNMSYIYTGMGKTDKAMSVLEESRQLAQESGDIKSLSESLLVLGAFYENTGVTRKAIDVYAECIDACEQSSNLPIKAMAKGNQANCYQKLGLLDKALPLMLQEVERLTALNQTTTLICSYTNLAVVQTHLGLLEDAERSLKAAGDLITQTGDKFYLCNWYTTYGDYFIHSGNLKKAHEYCMKAYETAVKFEAAPNVQGYSGCLYCYCVIRHEQNFTRAEEIIGELKDLLIAHEKAQETNLILLQGLMAAEQDNADEATRLFDTAASNLGKDDVTQHYLVAYRDLKAYVESQRN